MSFKNCSELNQARLRRNATLKSNTPGEGDQTDAEKRDTLRRRWHQLEQMLAVPTSKNTRAAIIREKMDVQAQLTAYKKRFDRIPNFEQWIVNVAKERLPKATFQGIVNEAKLQYEKANAAEEPEISES